MKLQSIAEERAACEAAWTAVPDATAGVHIHHEAPFEKLTEPIANRIAYIASDKPPVEQALRYRLMRPITAEQLAEYQRVEAPALAEWERAVTPAWAEYERVRDAALAEHYYRVRAPAWAEYERAVAPAWAEYERARDAAWAEYERAIKAFHDTICPTTDCPFDGRASSRRGNE